MLILHLESLMLFSWLSGLMTVLFKKQQLTIGPRGLQEIPSQGADMPTLVIMTVTLKY